MKKLKMILQNLLFGKDEEVNLGSYLIGGHIAQTTVRKKLKYNG